jgi:hypothetical protein
VSKGIAVPVRVNALGGVQTTEKDDDADKTIRLALSDNDNENAFQQGIGLGSDAVFAIRNPGFRAKVLARLLRIFAAFEKEKLFRIVRTSIAWSRGGEGEQILEFKYINLETDQPATFTRTFTAEG